MQYTIGQLEIYLKVVEKQSVTKASEELLMTQPAVSIQLKNFQKQFNVPLTEIVGRNLHVTEFGKDIAVIARRVLAELEELKFKTKEYEGMLTGELKISSASTGKYVIPFFLSDFLEAHSGIDLTLDVTNKAKVVESLRNNEIDFAVVSVLPDDLEVNEEVLIENRLYLMGTQDNFDRKMPLIFREQGSATRQVMEHYFQEGKKATKRKKLELTSNEAVKQSVLAGLGHSIIPLIGTKNQLVEGSLKIIEKKGLPLKTDWRLIWLKNKKLAPVAKGFLEHIQTEKQSILEKYFQWYETYT
jgi:LysR family transcriptional regulator, low CO2-responsive transcriptional regulator